MDTRHRLLLVLLCALLVGIPGSRPSFAAAPGTAPFANTWSRTDLPVANQLVSRTWMWGPEAHGVPVYEQYEESPGGQRLAQYFDKSRMEITNPNGDQSSVWYVTNGLLVVEMMTGQMQVGDNAFVAREPATVNVAGDADDPLGPTYATFAGLRSLPPLADGAAVIQRVDRNGNVTSDPSLAAHGVVAAQRVVVPGIDHQVASPFWAFMTSSGLVHQNGQNIVDKMFQDAYYATGLPVTEAYWANVKIAGTYRDVLMQCFERRCLTFTPGNPDGWQVEAGNVGLHYMAWRYGPDWTPPTPAPSAPTGKATNFSVSGNAFPWEANFPTYMSLMAETNVGRARLELHWHSIQPSSGQWQWSLYDDLVNQYVAAGIKPFGLLGYSVGWASGGSGSGMVLGPPTDLDAWEEYVFQTVSRYKDRIDAWEVWNEPDVALFWNGQDGGDPVYFTQMLERAYNAIKQADPSAIVINGAVTGTERGAAFLNTMHDNGAGNYLDVVGIHGYVTDDWLQHNLYPDLIWPQISAARTRYGKPIWVTEVGWNSGCSGALAACSEYEQAWRLVRNIAMLFTIGNIELMSVFQFKDPGDNPNYFGIVTNTAQKRQAHTAYATLVTRLTGLDYAGRVDRGPNVWALKFSSAARTAYVVWSTSGERDVTLDTDGHLHGFVHDIDGSWDYRAPVGGSIAVRVGGEPVIVEISD